MFCHNIVTLARLWKDKCWAFVLGSCLRFQVEVPTLSVNCITSIWSSQSQKIRKRTLASYASLLKTWIGSIIIIFFPRPDKGVVHRWCSGSKVDSFNFLSEPIKLILIVVCVHSLSCLTANFLSRSWGSLFSVATFFLISFSSHSSFCVCSS